MSLHAYTRMVDWAVFQWERLAFSPALPSLYLWYKTGELLAAENKPGDEYELANPERIPRNLDKRGVRHWIDTQARRLPIL